MKNFLISVSPEQNYIHLCRIYRSIRNIVIYYIWSSVCTYKAHGMQDCYLLVIPLLALLSTGFTLGNSCNTGFWSILLLYNLGFYVQFRFLYAKDCQVVFSHSLDSLFFLENSSDLSRRSWGSVVSYQGTFSNNKTNCAKRWLLQYEMNDDKAGSLAHTLFIQGCPGSFHSTNCTKLKAWTISKLSILQCST